MKFFLKLLELIKMSMKNQLAYVAEIWSCLIVSTLEIIAFYYLWNAVFNENHSMKNMTVSQIITYIILARVLYMQMSWGSNLSISDMIQTGKISMRLLSPIDFQLSMYMSRIGYFSILVFLQSFPSLIISIMLFGMLPPYSVLNFLCFIVSIMLSLTIAFLIEFGFGLLTFYTSSGWGLQHMKGAIISIFSGALIPLSFFPIGLRKIIDLMPFKDIIYTPISIYMGVISNSQIINALIFQLIWIAVLFLITRVFFNIAIRNVTVQGG